MKYLSIEQAATMLGLSTSTLYKKTSGRSIPFVKLGGRVLFEESALRRWLHAHVVQPIGFKQDFFEQEGNDAASKTRNSVRKKAPDKPRMQRYRFA